MELKTGKSTNAILKLLKSVTDAIIADKISGAKFILLLPISNEISEALKKNGNKPLI